jgi:hypothetical protein
MKIRTKKEEPGPTFLGSSALSPAFAAAILDTGEDVAHKLAHFSHLSLGQSCVVEAASGVFWVVILDRQGRATMTGHPSYFAAEEAASAS